MRRTLAFLRMDAKPGTPHGSAMSGDLTVKRRPILMVWGSVQQSRTPMR